MEKQCPRCGSKFECRHDDLTRCACQDIHLSANTRAYLKQNYSDCLCVNCLKELEKQLGAEATRDPHPTDPR